MSPTPLGLDSEAVSSASSSPDTTLGHKSHCSESQLTHLRRESRRRRPARPRPRPPQWGSGRVGSVCVAVARFRHRGAPTLGPGESAYPTRPAAARHEGPEGPITTLLGGGVAVNWGVPWLSKTNRADSPNNGYSLSTRQSLKREESLCSSGHSHPADSPNNGYSLSTRQSLKT